VAALPVCQRTRKAGANQLIGLRAHGNGRRYANKYQERRQQKPAADAKKTRQKAAHAAQQEHQQYAHRHFRDGEVNFHGGHIRRDWRGREEERP